MRGIADTDQPKRTFGAAGAAAAAPAKVEPPLDGPALRRLIVQGLNKATAHVAPAAGTWIFGLCRVRPSEALLTHDTAPTSARVTDADYDDIFADYGSLLPTPAAPAPAAADAAAAPAPSKHEYDGLF